MNHDHLNLDLFAENGRTRTSFYSYVVDDGWNLPYEVIEEINYRIARSQKEAYRDVLKQNRQHKGEWLTMDVANKYADEAWFYIVKNDGQYICEVREFGKELQDKYGVTELEAINILFENNVDDYVEKYYRIRNLIPVSVDQQRICDMVVAEYLFA